MQINNDKNSNLGVYICVCVTSCSSCACVFYILWEFLEWESVENRKCTGLWSRLQKLVLSTSGVDSIRANVMCFSWTESMRYTQFSKRSWTFFVCSVSLTVFINSWRKEKNKTSRTRFIFRFLSCAITSEISGRVKLLGRFSCSNELVLTHTHSRI